MRISTKGRYALRTLADIATQKPGTPVSLESISDRQGISQKYLWQIVSPLKKAGLVEVVRGSGGGCLLTRRHEHITLRDIIEAAEGPVRLVPCLCSKPSCKRVKNCNARNVWDKVNTMVLDSMASMTLESVLKEP